MIRVHNLEKIYDNDGVKTRALTGASFVIEKGEFLSIMGPSGSGKSTLMQVLGLLDRATGGTYELDGKDVTQFSDNELARLRNKKIGFVFQAFNLLPKTTVAENVELPLLYDDKIVESNQERVRAALEAVDMLHRADYLSNQLSGGEKQRVAIARALVNNPEIIFADEPTGNLDSKSGLQVMTILQRLNQAGRTIILVTHETSTAEHARRILSMKDGEIVNDQLVAGRRFADSEAVLK
ncbi:MAG: ABC transporter ATP-binding protein [Candidatus Moranbacteria bacterium]|nr:ABC transporter ATP-binding protein [Candidatus Moranbacteria bacterium]